MDGKLRNMTAIYIIKTNNRKVLLLFRKGGKVVNNVWVGSAGGHFEASELNDAKACILRELKEELELEESQLRNLSLRYITLRSAKGEIRQNYHFFAELREDADENLVSNEGICKWFSFSELSSLEMSFAARHVMNHYIEIGCKTDELYGGVADGETMIFTKMPEF